MNWNKIAAIARKDLGHFFVSPMGYVVMAIFYFVSGYFFWLVGVISKAAVIAAVLREFPGLSHRMQHVAVSRGVTFYDDSKATNVGAAVASSSESPSRAATAARSRSV